MRRRVLWWLIVSRSGAIVCDILDRAPSTQLHDVVPPSSYLNALRVVKKESDFPFGFSLLSLATKRDLCRRFVASVPLGRSHSFAVKCGIMMSRKGVAFRYDIKRRSSLEIAEERYARGEIDREEFERIKEDLR